HAVSFSPAADVEERQSLQSRLVTNRTLRTYGPASGLNRCAVCVWTGTVWFENVPVRSGFCWNRFWQLWFGTVVGGSSRFSRSGLRTFSLAALVSLAGEPKKSKIFAR